jgi:hypothetical protein
LEVNHFDNVLYERCGVLWSESVSFGRQDGGQDGPNTENMEGEVFEGVLLELVVCLENPPNRENMATGEVEGARLVEPPAIALRVAELARVEALDPAELGDEIPV